jgi:hypothetical protein
MMLGTRLGIVSLDVLSDPGYPSSVGAQATSSGAIRVKRRYEVNAGRNVKPAASVHTI